MHMYGLFAVTAEPFVDVILKHNVWPSVRVVSKTTLHSSAVANPVTPPLISVTVGILSYFTGNGKQTYIAPS